MNKWTWSDIYKINIDDLRVVAKHYLNEFEPFDSIETHKTLKRIINKNQNNYEEKLAWFSEIKNKDIIDEFFKLMDDSNIEYTEIGDMPTAVDWVTDQIKNWKVVDNDMLYELCVEYLTDTLVIIVIDKPNE